MNSDERERLEQIRERWSVKASNTKSWGEWPTLQSVGGIKGAIADINFLLSLLNDRETSLLSDDDDDLAIEMNKVSERLVGEWYRESQHRDELVEEIAVTLTAAHRRSEANAATGMRDKCVETLKQIAADYDKLRFPNTGAMISKQAILYGVRQIESLTLGPRE